MTIDPRPLITAVREAKRDLDTATERYEEAIESAIRAGEPQKNIAAAAGVFRHTIARRAANLKQKDHTMNRNTTALVTAQTTNVAEGARTLTAPYSLDAQRIEYDFIPRAGDQPTQARITHYRDGHGFVSELVVQESITIESGFGTVPAHFVTEGDKCGQWCSEAGMLTERGRCPLGCDHADHYTNDGHPSCADTSE